MLHKNKLKIMELFFEEPIKHFQIRGISRMTGIAVTSVKNYLHELEKGKLIQKIKGEIYDSYVANLDNRMFKLYKQQNMIIKIYAIGLIDYLEENLYPKTIILFGSVRKGEYTKTSDIDIFIQGKEKTINLDKFEKSLKHTINLFFEESLNNLSEELFNNIINGIKLSGYIKWQRK